MRNKVRFNLSPGENYMKWKVMYDDGRVVYYRPTDVQIVMKGCTLKNNRAAAMKIFNGLSYKTVCAWVLCDEVHIITEDFKIESDKRIKYNPRNLPFWNMDGRNMDSENVKELFSVDYGLYLA